MSGSTLRFEHLGPTLGGDDPTPRIAGLPGTGNTAVSAYELECRHDDQTTEHTGLMVGAPAGSLKWPFSPLRSRDEVAVRARIWLRGVAQDWTAPIIYETGLLHREDWEVDFIAPPTRSAHPVPRPAHYFRAGFTIASDVTKARLYITAHGMFEARMNGQPISDELFAPGWSSYNTRLRYRTYDLTSQVRPGENALGAILADGWYRGKLGFNGGRTDNYGSELSLLAQLEVYDRGGIRHLIDLSDAWRHAPGPIVSTGIYEGEHHDARLEDPGWDRPGFADASWSRPVQRSLEGEAASIVAPTGPPVRVIETLDPVECVVLPHGRVRLDFGQNISGRLRITVSGDAGRVITLRHAEVLEDGELALRPLRGAPSVDRYVLAGNGIETWSPRFTFHGFRYAEVEGWPGDMALGAVVAEVVHTDMTRTGWFTSSDPLLNQLHSNIAWSMRGNFVDLPTDCPQRDERLGWTGDIQVFAPTAAFLYDVTPTLRGWLRDLSNEQKTLGTVPNFVPWVECGFPLEPTAAWGDAAVIVPWVLYQRTGDVRLLADQYPSMTAWVDQVHARTRGTGLWDEGFQLGDWLDPTAPHDRPDASRTDARLVATAYHAHSARLLSRASEILGKPLESTYYAEIAATATNAFQREFVAPNGRLVSDTETAHSLALVFDLLTHAQRIRAGQRLVELVEDADYFIRTGFVGTPIICEALTQVGAVDTAYHLLAQRGCPSWLYPITMGATTVWERWDSMLPDGSINPGEMTSFNHYSLGAVADFLHTRVAGLRHTAPGYATFEVAPLPGGVLTSCEVTHISPFGAITVRWRRDVDLFLLELTVPAGTIATVRLPGTDEHSTVGTGVHSFSTVFRSAVDDPKPRIRHNIHSPEERRELTT